MNMTAERRATAYIRRLKVGDRFLDFDGTWEVTRNPLVRPDNSVHIWLLPVPRKRGRRPYSQRFVYDRDSRVQIVRR